uniref:CSD domain-containing protein n=1 Tax=Alexandrium monilatum TaxID=311494 RepID=A0A7S4R3P1_9DINO|mmetsp:Transcript_43121/g.128793  ORF Transcript_43121/g.128793 Transcript_43121/m.128793 type:complete len:430 (-) Transcript_43121:20-1309(-)
MVGGMIPQWLSQLLAIPWIEEVFMILITAVVYILIHSSLMTSSKSPPKKGKGEGKLATEEDEAWSAEPRRLQRRLPGSEERSAGGTKSTMPKTSAEVEGVTDSRFEGVVVCYKPDEGYGFIRCPELYRRFGRDVFLHRLQVGSFEVGAQVTFGVFLNKQGLPQAKELEAAETKWEVDATAPQAPEQAPTSELQEVPSLLPAALPESRQPLNPHAECYVAKQAVNLFSTAPSETAQFSPNSYVTGYSVPALAPKGWASVETLARTLSGIWLGERGFTYEVHFYIKPRHGEPVGTVLRCRPDAAPKSFALHWDAASGHLQLNQSFVLDLQALAECPDTAGWWRGQSNFIWQRLQPNAGRYKLGSEDSWSCCDSQQWDTSWAGHKRGWGTEDEWSQSTWTEGEKCTWKAPRAWAAQPQTKAWKRWVRKEQPR